jgi:hypothetical protein
MPFSLNIRKKNTWWPPSFHPLDYEQKKDLVVTKSFLVQDEKEKNGGHWLQFLSRMIKKTHDGHQVPLQLMKREKQTLVATMCFFSLKREKKNLLVAMCHSHQK